MHTLYGSITGGPELCSVKLVKSDHSNTLEPSQGLPISTKHMFLLQAYH